MSIQSINRDVSTTSAELTIERRNHVKSFSFPSQPVLIPNERTRKITVYSEAVDFSDELAELNACARKKAYAAAYKISKNLFDFYLVSPSLEEKTELIELFEKIIKKGKTVLGNEFYAFLRAAITADIECIDGHNPEDVIKGYKEAAELGNKSASYFLGRYYARQERYDDAFQQFLACVNQFPDYVEAIKELAIYYHQGGDLVPADLKRAEFYYRKATDLGCKDSPCNLAGMLESRLVTTDANRTEVIYFYDLAKSRGSSDAAYNLGVIYQTGWYRTAEDGQKLYALGLINYDEAEANFREAYSGEMSDVNAAGVAEIIFDNKSKLTATRWNEMKGLIARIKENGSNDADDLIQKIEAFPSPFSEPSEVIDNLQILATAATNRLADIQALARRNLY